MLYYSKISAAKPHNVPYDLFVSNGATPDLIFLDFSSTPKLPEGIFNKLKDRLLKTGDSLTIDSLNSLGKNGREISKELQWFVNNHIKLIILDLPLSMRDAVSPIEILSELYAGLAKIEIENVKNKQASGIQRVRELNKPIGRKKIPYPDNWEPMYRRWERKEISVSEFMQLTNLKKGTLYNLIKQYKENTVSPQQDENIG